MSEINEELLEYVINQRLDKNQAIRERIIDELGKDIETTLKDKDSAHILLSTLKDSDSIDVKRLTIKQAEKEMDVAERVLSLLDNISSQVKRNPYYVEDANPVRQLERPATFYDGDDISEGELSSTGSRHNYHSFMDSRKAIPTADNRSTNDSTSDANRSLSDTDDV